MKKQFAIKRVLATVLTVALLSQLLLISAMAKEPSSSSSVKLMATGTLSGDFYYTDDGTNATITGYNGAGGAVAIPATIGGRSVTAIGLSAFDSNTTVTSVTFPASLITIGEKAFYKCTSLTGVTIPANVTTIGATAFFGCTSLTTLTIAAGSSLTTIDAGAFKGCSLLTAVSIPAGVTTLGNGAFERCSKLTSATFAAGINLSKIDDYTFYLSGLTSVTIPASVKSIGLMAFRDCANLTSVTFEAGSLLETIGNSAFWYGAMTSVIIPKNVTSIAIRAFEGCKNLTTLTFEAGSLLTTIGASAFNACAIDKVNFPAKLVTLESLAFSANTPLKEITFSGTGLTTLGVGCFQKCSSLVTVDLSAQSNLVTIDANTFNSCTALTSATLPASVSSIGSAAFLYDLNLAWVRFLGDPPTIDSGAFTAYYALNTKVTMIYPPSSTIWTTPTYGGYHAVPDNKVIYHGNGSTDGTVTDSTKYTSGQTVTVLACAYTRTHYTFQGWDTVPNGNGANYSVGSTFAYNGPIILYAQWLGDPCTITYSSNGATYTTQAVKYGDKLTAPAEPTRTGYIFGGWYKNSSFATAWNFASDTAAGTATLYAKWSKTLMYNGNGATGGSVPAAVTDIAATISGNTGSLVKTGYTFAGWNTKADGTGTDYNVGAKYTLSEDIILYAKWVVVVVETTYTLAYNGNGATGGTVPLSANYTSGQTVAISGNTGSLVKTGYTFAGWNTKADGSGTDYKAGDSLTVSANITLYAKWTSGTVITVPDYAASPNDYIVAYWDVNGKKVINPMSYYDSTSGNILYKGSGCQGLYNFVSFRDVTEDNWSSASIWFLASRNVITGSGDGNFYPAQNVTRAEFLKMLASLTPNEDYSSYSTSTFKDVPAGSWYLPFVGWGCAHGIANGYDSVSFGPNDLITREQMCVMIDRYLQYKGMSLASSGSKTAFSDAGSISSWAADSITKLKQAGLVNGVTATEFAPKGNASREQSATVLARLLRSMLSSMSSPNKLAWNASK